MKYNNNECLMNEYDKLLIDLNLKKQDIADILGISKQTLYALTQKKHITFDDMKKILNACGYELEYQFIKKNN